MKELSKAWEEFKATDRILIFESVVYGFAFCQALLILLFLIQRRNHWKHTIFLCLALAEFGVLGFLIGRLTIAFIAIKFQPNTLSDSEYGILIWAVLSMFFAKVGYIMAAVTRTRALSSGKQPLKIKITAALVYLICAADIASNVAITAIFFPVMKVQNRMHHGEATISEFLALLPGLLVSLSVEPGINTLLTVIVNMSFLYTMFIKLNIPYARAVKVLAQQGDVIFIVAATALAIFDCATSSNVLTVTFQTQIMVFLRISFETSKSIIVSHESSMVSNASYSRTPQRSTMIAKKVTSTNGNGNIRTTPTIGTSMMDGGDVHV